MATQAGPQVVPAAATRPASPTRGLGLCARDRPRLSLPCPFQGTQHSFHDTKGDTQKDNATERHTMADSRLTEMSGESEDKESGSGGVRI